MIFSTLDSLLESQKGKKKGLNKEEQTKYRTEIETLLLEEGLSEKAIHYISILPFHGGVKGLINWYYKLSEEEKAFCINELLNSKNAKLMNNSKKYKFVLELLSVTLSDKQPNFSVIKQLLYQLDSLSYTKEGTRINDLDVSFKKSFFNNITENIALPPFSKIGLTDIYAKKIISLFDQSLASIDATSSIEISKKELLLQWLNESRHSELKNINTDVQIPLLDNKASPTDAFNNTFAKNPEKKDSSIKNQHAKKLLEIAYVIDELEHKNKKLNIENNILNKKVKDFENILIVEQKRRLELEDINLNLKQENIELIEVNSKLHSEVTSLTDRVVRQASVLNVYTEDKANSQSEQLNSIASSLVKYYKDYEIAVSMTMTTELEMTLLDLIEDIFRRLEKCGVDVKGRK